MRSLKTNIQELAKNSPALFKNKKLALYRTYSDNRYFLPDTISENTTVDISKVVGHSQCYPEMHWSYMLGLRGMGNTFEELVKNPKYYLSNEVKVDFSFTEIEGNYFIDEGKHRTTVFKYFAHFNPYFFKDAALLRGVSVTHKNVNYALENNIKKIEQLLLQERFSHIKFGVRKACRDLPTKYYLKNTKRTVGYEFFDEVDLPMVFELIQDDSSLTRFFGKGLGSFLRASTVFPW